MDIKKQLVIVPGWGGTPQTWEKFTDLAKNDLEVIFIDMPCFGDIPCPQTAWGVEEYAEFVKGKVENLEKPILLGHSFGGQVAVNLVANNPEMFAKLILSGAAVIRHEKTFKSAVFSVMAKTGKFIFKIPVLHKAENLARKILYKVADSPDYTKTDGIKREIFQKIIRQSQEDKLEKIKLPTLVVWGTKDSYVPLSDGKKIAEKIAGAELNIIEGGKHGLHIQQPENLLKIVRKFIHKND